MLGLVHLHIAECRLAALTTLCSFPCNTSLSLSLAMAESDIVRFGILGCANIARKVSRAIRLAPNACLYAVGSRSADKAARFAADNGFPPTVKVYGSYDAVLDDPDVDAVYVPLPTSLHVRWAVAAASKGKHVLLEKPVALNVDEFDQIAAACESSGVQFMDGTMWMHHPRTAKMRELLSDGHRFGDLKLMQACMMISTDSEFLKTDIRVKPDLDALGCLGDVGWYCISGILWTTGYKLPQTVTAIRGTIFNEAGVIVSCGASLLWADGKVATFHCSFLTNLTSNLTAIGTRGTLSLDDFVIPFNEGQASFSFASKSGFDDLVTRWNTLPSSHTINTELPQEALMVTGFAGLVKNVKENGAKPDNKWPAISRKSQLVVNAVKESIEKGYEPIVITN